MSKILIVDDEPDMRDLTSMLIELEYDYEVVTASCGEEAMDILRKDPDIMLVLSDYSMPKGNGAYLYNNMVKEGLRKPFALITGGFLERYHDFEDFSLDSPLNFYLNKPYKEEEFQRMLLQMLNQVDVPLTENRDGLAETDLKRVRISFLKTLYSGNIDIYVKISNEKFVKVISANDKASNDEFSKYEAKGESYLYLNEKDVHKLIVHIFNKFADDIKKAKSLKETSMHISKGMKVLQSTLDFFGINESQPEMIDASVNKCLEQLSKNKSLLKAVKLFREDKDYLSAHSLISLHISYLLCEEMGVANEQLLTKFSYACLLHDICLGKKDWSQIISVEDKLYKDLPANDQQNILDHPHKASDTVMKLSEIPAEVWGMIRQHHERPNGSGFPDGILSSRISTNSSIFILSLEVAHHLYFYGEMEIDKLKERLKKEFDVDNFKKPLACLIKILK